MLQSTYISVVDDEIKWPTLSMKGPLLQGWFYGEHLGLKAAVFITQTPNSTVHDYGLAGL